MIDKARQQAAVRFHSFIPFFLLIHHPFYSEKCCWNKFTPKRSARSKPRLNEQVRVIRFCNRGFRVYHLPIICVNFLSSIIFLFYHSADERMEEDRLRRESGAPVSAVEPGTQFAAFIYSPISRSSLVLNIRICEMMQFVVSGRTKSTANQSALTAAVSPARVSDSCQILPRISFSFPLWL